VTDHEFCRMLLRESRAAAKRAKLDVPQLSVWSCPYAGSTDRRYFEVSRKQGAEVLWQGAACCAWEAKSKAIDGVLVAAGHG
jgi:hypothetical protein